MLIYHYLHRMDKTLGRLGSDLFGLKATRLTTLVLAVLLVGLLITALNIWQLSTLQVNSLSLLLFLNNVPQYDVLVAILREFLARS